MVKVSVIVGFIIMFLLMSVLTEAVSASLPQYRFQRALVEIEHPDEVRRVLNGVVESLLASESGKTEKRGLDLGLSRGFSGSQAAKHLMGLAAANFAGGPGRRRRDVSNEE
ncbi:diuretic hormone class 2-like [Tachypleus tridentatus]|uniref:diuretic hormone class 2-like n=1 Tax=Tachypleus tridentatus TaxID=6853 RepID=UPI003FD06BE0